MKRGKKKGDGRPLPRSAPPWMNGMMLLRWREGRSDENQYSHPFILGSFGSPRSRPSKIRKEIATRRTRRKIRDVDHAQNRPPIHGQAHTPLTMRIPGEPTYHFNGLDTRRE